MSIEPDRQQVDRQNLADVLRELRRAAGISGERLAARCGISQSKISRIERGRLLPSVVDVERVLAALDVPADRARDLLELARAANVDYTSARAIARLGLDHWQRNLTTLIESAAVFRQFLPAIPPGFLQVRGYAERVMTRTVPSEFDGKVGKAVSARMEMRSVLDNESCQFFLMMTEQAVRWSYAGPDIMAQQVRHMAREAQRPNVEIAVIPWRTEVCKGPVSIFSVLDERLVLVELFSGSVSLRDPRDVHYHLELFKFFYGHALTGDDAFGFLESVADDFGKR